MHILTQKVPKYKEPCFLRPGMETPEERSSSGVFFWPDVGGVRF